MAETFNKVKDNVELLLRYFSHLERNVGYSKWLKRNIGYSKKRWL
jgi:hypothetical protein